MIMYVVAGGHGGREAERRAQRTLVAVGGEYVAGAEGTAGRPPQTARSPGRSPRPERQPHQEVRTLHLSSRLLIPNTSSSKVVLVLIVGIFFLL